MNAKSYEYLSKKVYKYELLEELKNKLNTIQELLVRDVEMTIKVRSSITGADREEDSYCLNDRELAQTQEYQDLMREIKDNLIDSIGMKIVEINDKMEEL